MSYEIIFNDELSNSTCHMESVGLTACSDGVCLYSLDVPESCKGFTRLSLTVVTLNLLGKGRASISGFAGLYRLSHISTSS